MQVVTLPATLEEATGFLLLSLATLMVARVLGHLAGRGHLMRAGTGGAGESGAVATRGLILDYGWRYDAMVWVRRPGDGNSKARIRRGKKRRPRSSSGAAWESPTLNLGATADPHRERGPCLTHA
jgi:hypothetical protein